MVRKDTGKTARLSEETTATIIAFLKDPELSLTSLQQAFELYGGPLDLTPAGMAFTFRTKAGSILNARADELVRANRLRLHNAIDRWTRSGLSFSSRGSFTLLQCARNCLDLPCPFEDDMLRNFPRQLGLPLITSPKPRRQHPPALKIYPKATAERLWQCMNLRAKFVNMTDSQFMEALGLPEDYDPLRQVGKIVEPEFFEGRE